MIRNVLKVMRNEWKSNLLIGIELMLVGIFLWVIVDGTYIALSNYLKPLGFDTEHTYIANIGYFGEHSSLYQSDLTREREVEYFHTIVDRIGAYPGVEAVSVSFHSSPHIGSNRNTAVSSDTTHISEYVLLRSVTPDFFKVFDWKSADGSTEELVQALQRGDVVVSPQLVEQIFPEKVNPMGRYIYWGRGEQEHGKVGAVSTTIRYDDFAYDMENFFVVPFSEDYFRYFAGPDISHIEFCFRVSPDADHNFIPRFREQMSEQLMLGNFYLAKVDYIPDNKHVFQASDRISMYNNGYMILFLLINIFLGIVGVFWFRTQARVKDMGVRLAFGDTPAHVLFQYFCEGIVLVFISLLPSMGLIYYLSTIGKYIYTWAVPFTFVRFLIGYGFTFLLLVIMVIMGVWFPARRVIRISPARALATE